MVTKGEFLNTELEFLRKMIELSLKGKSAKEITDEMLPAFKEIRARIEQEKAELLAKREEYFRRQKEEE